MRILFHHRIASRDGQAVHLEELTHALRVAGHEVIVIGPASFDREAFGGSSGTIDRLKARLPAALFELMEIGYNLVALIRLHRAVRRHRPDVLYERHNLFLLAGIVERRLSGLKLLLEVNAPLYEERAANETIGLKSLAHWCQRVVWRQADAVLPVTEVLAGIVESYGVPRARIAVIPNGINPERFAAPPPLDEAKAALGLAGRTVLGFTGFVRAWHRIDIVLDYIARSGRPDLHLLLVGDGPVRAELEAYAAAHGIADRLTITGVVPRDRVAAMVAAFDVALQPALTPYASPLKLFEYLWLERAVLAPDTANIREVLTHGEDALLFEPDRPESQHALLDRLVRDPDERLRLGRAARATMERRGFTWARNAERVVALAERLASGSG